MSNFLCAIVVDDSGATAVEYGLIAALISIAGVAALTTIGNSLTGIFSYISVLTQAAAS